MNFLTNKIMKLDITYTLILTDTEAQALKKTLGSMSNEDFSKLGIKGEDMETMHEIWDAIPYGEDE